MSSTHEAARAFAPAPADARVRFRRHRPAIALRLAITVFLVYALHFASNVVRETYLAMSIGEHLSLRVDEYLGLHPDLFEIPGRGAYINNNPGASMLGALPYALASPAINALLRLKPELARPKPASTYDDPRPNRTRFLNEARARGLDVKLGLAALVTQVGLMAPLGAAGALAMFLFLRARLRDERRALWLALLYAFGTPIFFRSAFLNQNAIIAHCVLFAFIVLAHRRPGESGTPISPLAAAAAGALLGFAILCDYSGVALAVAFGIWVLVMGWRSGGPAQAVRSALWFGAGAAGPIAVLLAYQWAAFGNPLFPAQRYMPATSLSVHGWNGLSVPTGELLWRNLLDPRYGLFIFSPMLLAALAAPFLRRRPGGPSGEELALLFGASAAIYLFSSANQFALLQWNTGVRYLVPAASLLFFALVPVMLRMPVWLRWTLILPTLTISWAVSMTRESVPRALEQVLIGGFQLPFLTVLEKTAAAYAPFLEHGASPLPLFLLLGVVLWLIWRPVAASLRSEAERP